MAPPQRRGGGGSEGRGGAAKSGGRGGRGARGGGRGRGANAEPPAAPESQQLPAAAAEGGGGRNAKPKPQRKPRGSDVSRSSASGGALPARPVRAVSIVRRKVLIRNVPHDWDEDKLAALVEANGATREHMWRFVPGKLRSNNRAPRPGRLYLDFKRETELAKSVIEKLHGYAIPDSKDEMKLDVDFAPFQKIPREKQRKDAKVGTIDRDPDFVAFLEALTKPKEKLPSADVAAESKDAESGADKPVAALVQFLNERKRDKKGKFAGKGTDKTRGSRTKSMKEGKGAKEKTKSSKGKAKTSEPSAAKEPTKTRKTRVKLPKEKSVEGDQVEPGAIKIMGSKTRDNSVSRSEAKPTVTQEAAASDAGEAPTKGKPVGGKSGGGKSFRNRTAEMGHKEPSSESTAVPAEASASSKEAGAKGSGRSRRDSRASKGPKGGGRGDQPKKVFAPKVTTPAG